MPSYSNLSPEELYKQGLQQFNRADWQGAISSFLQLQEISDQYPDVDGLIADARLKLQFEGSSQPTALAPPRRPVLLPVMAAIALLLVAASAIGFYFLNASQPDEIVAMVTEIPVPTATARPTIAPTAVPTPEPTEAPLLPATVLITSEGTFVNTPSNIHLIVDASGSMLAKMPDGRERWEVAQEALNALVNSDVIANESSMVVRTYGRRRGNDCGDLELVQGLIRYNKDGLLGIVPTLKPAVGGTTPLGASLQLANEDLKAAEGSTVIILLTDGVESCNGDPVGAAAEFVSGTDQRKVHVIGFALGDDAASNNLRQIATAGQGKYFDANNAAQLADALRETITLSYRVFDQNNQEVATGTVGGPPIQLQPGTYTLKIDSLPPIEETLEVESGAEITVSVQRGFSGLIAKINQKKK